MEVRNLDALAIAPEYAHQLTGLKPGATPRRAPKVEFTQYERAAAPKVYLDGPVEPNMLAEFRAWLWPLTKAPSDTPLLLIVDSPGGYTTGVEETRQVVERVARMRPVVVLVEGLCCSAAYMIICPAQRVVATPSSTVGSCGTIVTLLDDSEAFRQMGLRFVYVSSADAKQMGYPGKEVTADDIARAERRVNGLNNLFEVALLKSPRLNEDQVIEALRAETYTAAQAKRVGLVDEVLLAEELIEQIDGAVVDRFERFKGDYAVAKLNELVAEAAGCAAYRADQTVIDRVRAEYPQLAAEAFAHERRR